ncbi:SGNH/GDSL hydrolase family protein [Streptomyces sp. 6N223]|uniref:SGNH/GDSL hydrolase family protein n=1 Tax=Streptomyces sp. 6N223 TaxID=3457412 RepID=UPI003FD424D7
MGAGAPDGVVASPPEALRFTALGDSLTEGLGDPAPHGGCRGWAALLAAALPAPGQPVQLVNLARSGARTIDTAGEQLAAARRLRPHVAALVIGVNDTLRSAFDISRVARALDTTLRALTEDGAIVLTACLPDPGRMLRLPRALGCPLARRMRALNEVVHALSDRYDTVHAHLAEHPMVTDRHAWSVDRLHPSELGHRLLAREFHSLLAARGHAAGPPPSPTPDRPPPTRAAGTWWMATRGTRWVLARSTDLLPGLLRLAAAEAAHRLAGTEATLERATREATAAALRALAPGPPGDAPDLARCPSERALGILD